MATLGVAVDLVLGDFDNPGSISAAAYGCVGMYLVVRDSDKQVQQETQAGQLAIKAGVTHIVKLSSNDAELRRSYWAVAHHDMELAIAKMDVGYSFIRPNYFMEGLLGLFKVDSNRNITLEVPTGNGQIGVIDTYGIGESSAELLASGKPLNGHAMITGTRHARLSSSQS